MTCECENETKTLKYIQGATFFRQVEVLTDSGDAVDVSFISSVEFLLLDINANEEVSSQLVYDTDIGKWIVSLPTDTWKVGTHIYRYMTTYVDEKVDIQEMGNIQIKK